jgi:hypothetical protein
MVTFNTASPADSSEISVAYTEFLTSGPVCFDKEGPSVTQTNPLCNASVSETTSFFFELVDSGGGSVVLSTVQVVVEINGVPETAVLNGAFTAGWVGSSMVAVPNGYQFTLVRTTPYGSSATIEFFIDASDDVVPPNAMATFSCALTTAFFTPVCRLAECRIVSLLGGIIQLDARESSSPDGATLDFEWKFTQVPMGSVFEADVGVVNPASVKDLRPSTYSAISFIPDKLGDYLVELTAVNGLSRSDPCTALVSIGLS